MGTHTCVWPRHSRMVIRLTALALMAALFTAAFLSTSAKASHTIRPAWIPQQLSPYFSPPAGYPGPDQFVSTPATRCNAGPHPWGSQGGTYLLWLYLHHWYPRGENWGIYACRTVSGSSSYSLHAEGRALDFHLENTDPYDKAHGDQIFLWFLRQDAAGHSAAMARRFGIQEIIWNCAHWSVNGGLRTYYKCDPNHPKFTWDRTQRHENHVHIGQNPYGAGGHTTAYTGYRVTHRPPPPQ